MINFLVGLIIGVAFSPFWLMLWTTYIKPAIDKVVTKVKSK